MTTALDKVETVTGATMEQALIGGDLSKLTAGQRLAFYNQVCESLGLNPLTKPFAYITLNGKLTLYALRDCTDQLRKIHNVSVEIMERGRFDDAVFVVRARATFPSGRTDESLGAVNIKGIGGETLANALMKAETKAKRRVTLSICGLGWLDETEAETIAKPNMTMTVQGNLIDTATGEIIEGEHGPLAPKPEGFDDWHADLRATADEGTKALEKVWKASAVEYRRHLTTTAPEGWESIKDIAARVKVEK